MVKNFLSANCGFFDASNRCNCKNVLAGHISQGWIDPQKPVFVNGSEQTQDPIKLRQYLKELDELSRISVMFKSVLTKKCATDFAATLKDMVAENNYRILSDPQIN